MSSLAGMSLSAVPMDTVAEERNGKGPGGNRKTKTREKQAHEKPRQGNGLMRTTYSGQILSGLFVSYSSLEKRVMGERRQGCSHPDRAAGLILII